MIHINWTVVIGLSWPNPIDAAPVPGEGFGPYGCGGWADPPQARRLGGVQLSPRAAADSGPSLPVTPRHPITHFVPLSVCPFARGNCQPLNPLRAAAGAR